MPLKLGTPSATYSAADQGLMRGALERADAQNLKKGAVLDELLMRAEDGKVVKLTITGPPYALNIAAI